MRLRDQAQGVTGSGTNRLRQYAENRVIVGEGGGIVKIGADGRPTPPTTEFFARGASGAAFGGSQGQGVPRGSGGGGLPPNLAKSARAVSSYRDLYAPRFFIEADGALASDLIPFITSFDYEDDVAKISTLRITVLNPGLRFADDPRFQDGVRFRFRFGYLDDISDIYSAVIAKAKPSFPQSGVPTIQMVAFGIEKDMNKHANPMNHGPVSSSDVAKVIADRYKFDQQEIEDSKDARRQNRIQPAGVSDMQYLMSLAYKLNWTCYVRGGVFHFHPRRYDKPAVLEYAYFTDETGTLLSFDPNVNMNQPPQSKTAGADTKKGEKASAERDDDKGRVYVNTNTTQVGGLIPSGRGNAGSSNSPQNQSGPQGHVGAGITAASPEGDPQVMKLHATARSTRVDMEAVKAAATMIGTPRLSANEMIRIVGVDQQYSGNWYIVKSKHSISPSGGYKTQVELSRDAGKAKTAEQNKGTAGNAAAGAGGQVKGRAVINTNATRVFAKAGQ